MYEKKEDNSWHEIGRTEVIANNLSKEMKQSSQRTRMVKALAPILFGGLVLS